METNLSAQFGHKFSKKKWLLIGIIVFVLLLAAALILVWLLPKERVEPVQTTEEALDVLSEAPSIQVETNPIKKVPDLNPVEKTNPFKILNPFK